MHKLITNILPVTAGYVHSNTDQYFHGSFVVLTATSCTGYVFDHWEINEKVVKIENPLILNIDEDKIINTYFLSTDKEIPVITQFEGPASTTVKDINIFLDGTDNRGIAAWVITTSPAIPDVNSPDWTSTKPYRYSFSQAGISTLYAWAKDENGNISASKSITVTIVDNKKPDIANFAVPAFCIQPVVSLLLKGSDNFAITHWMVSESSAVPLPDNPGWQTAAPATYTFSTEGIFTLYAWAKDSSGNVSESKTAGVIYDAKKPLITSFSAPPTSSSFIVPVTLQGTDNRGIAGWLLSNNPETPSLSSSLWSTALPATYRLPMHGRNTVYAWAKDEAGNISAPASVEVIKNFEGAWTIMIWLDADNNLESNALIDLNEIEYGLYEAKRTDPDIEDKLAVIVQIDRIYGYDNDSHDDGPDWYGTRRYLMQAQSTPFTDENITSCKLDDLGEVNMGDAENLKLFIEYCKDNFPAEHYGLLFWNHGGGVRNITSNTTPSSKELCWDTTDNNDVLYIGEITDTLTDDQDVEFIGFDACSMGMAEVAYEYRPGDGKFGADYMVGSPANIQLDGWEYNRIFKRLKGVGYTDSEGDECYDIGTITAEQWAGIFVKEYKDAYNTLAPETLAAFDLSLIEDVKTKLDNLAKSLKNEKTLCESLRGTGASTVVMNYFDEKNANNWINCPHFDMYDFAERVENNISYANISAILAAEALKTSIEACVLFSWGGADYVNFAEGKNGLGFFFPDGNKTYAQQYWYTGTDIFHLNGYHYGNLDFCNTNSDGSVQSWKELLEYWYDNTNTFTPETW